MFKIKKKIEIKKKTFFLFHLLCKLAGASADFAQIMSDSQFFYIDKTEHVANLMMESQRLIFFNRPRRFGKSMLLETLGYCYQNGLNPKIKPNRELKIYSDQLFEENALNQEWKHFKEKFSEEKVIALKLDFSSLNNYAAENKFKMGMHELIQDEIKKCLKFYKSINDIIVVDFLASILKTNYNDGYSLLRALLNNYNNPLKTVLLIDEYESPLLHVMEFHKNLLQSLEGDFFNLFTILKSLLSNSNLLKVVMTGVISLRHLSAFSGGNSFKNYSLNEKYRESFGFNLKEITTHKILCNTINNLLQKHNAKIPGEFKKNDLKEQRNHFILKLFEAYNGYKFTKESLKLNISLISPISFIEHLETLINNNDENPYEFNDYYGATGGTRYIKVLSTNNLDPVRSIRILNNAISEDFDLDILNKSHDYKLAETGIPLNLLLYNCGYFTIKKIIRSNLVKLDWTNESSKNAFYDLYIKDLQFTINDLLTPLQKENYKSFIYTIKHYFSKMLKKHYDDDFNDEEHNQVILFFSELLSKIKIGEGGLEIYNFFKLTDRQNSLNNKGIGTPDLIFIYDFVKKDQKIVKKMVILEFYKTDAQKHRDRDYTRQLLNCEKFKNIKNEFFECNEILVEISRKKKISSLKEEQSPIKKCEISNKKILNGEIIEESPFKEIFE